MARDPAAPVDAATTPERSTDPSQTIPARGPQGDTSDLDGGEYAYWLRDGATPYRSSPEGDDMSVFSKADDAWMYQHMVDKDKMWPSSAGEIAGMIGGGRQRLTEPVKGAMPMDPGPGEDFAPVPSPTWSRPTRPATSRPRTPTLRSRRRHSRTMRRLSISPRAG